MNRTNNPNSMVPFNNVKIQLEQQMTVLNPTDQGLNQEHPQAASIAQLFNTFGSTTQTSSSDTEVQKIAALMREYIEENKLNDFLVVPVSNQQTGNYGAVAFCNKRVTESGSRIFCHIAMVEKSKQTEQQSAIVNYGATPVEVFVSVADAYTPAYVQKVTAALQRHFGDAAQIAAGGWSVVYRDTPVTLDEFRPFIVESMIAIEHAVSSTKRDRPVFNLGMLTGQNPVKLRNHILLDQYKLSPSGIPVRSDIKSELVLSQSSGNKSVVDETSELRICDVSAYVDLIYVPPNQGFFGGMAQPTMMGQAPVPYYIPRINITNFAMDLPNSSVEFMLLGIASIASLAKNRSYGIVWRDQFGSSANLKRNLGAVGLQVQGLTTDGTPGILDVSSDVRMLYQLMQTVLAENPVFTLELTQGGQSNWATTIIAKIATGDVRSQELLIQACDNLTQGKFTPIYTQLCQQSGGALQQIVTASDEPSLIGTYKHEGETRDIRELDLLAVLNLIGQKDPDMVMGYLSTFAGNEPVQVRLDRRARILKLIAKDVKIMAYSRKYDFGGLFIQALTAAIAANGVIISNDNFMNSTDNVYSQTISQWQGSMVNSQAISGLFQQQPIAMQGQGNWTVGGIYGVGGMM